jgi:hypothetical protein
MPPEVLDEVEEYPGNTWAFALTITDRDTGAPVNLTGFTLESTISTTPPIVATVAAVNLAQGQIEVQVLHGTTDDVSPGRYLGDVLTGSAAGVWRTAKRFWVIVKPTPSLP